jgi:hypothetical protein
MDILKFAAAIGLMGLSLAGCVDDAGYGGGYGGGVVYSSGYGDGYNGGYGGGYNDGYRPYRRYDNYSNRRWDNGGDYRRPNRDWQGDRRPDRNQGGSRPDNNQAQNRPQPNRPDRQDNRPQNRNNQPGPYSPDSCGALDCTGLSTRGSNR